MLVRSSTGDYFFGQSTNLPERSDHALLKTEYPMNVWPSNGIQTKRKIKAKHHKQLNIARVNKAERVQKTPQHWHKKDAQMRANLGGGSRTPDQRKKAPNRGGKT
jgi:hypothetical protein